MPIEKRITEALEARAMEAKRSPELDNRIGAWFAEQASMNKGGARMKKGRSKAAILAMVALIAIVVTGFSAKYFFSIGDDRILLNYATMDQARYEPELAAEARSQVEEVRRQLAVGESALVYSKALNELLPNAVNLQLPTGVSNPFLYTDLKEWQLELQQQVPGYRTFDAEALGLAFINGKSERAFGEVITPDQDEAVSQLREELKETDRAYVWKKLVDTGANKRFPAYTSTYQNAQGQIFTIMMEVMKEKVVMKSLIQGKDMEEVNLNGKQALYGESHSIWFSPTDENRSLIFVDTQQDSSIIYTISSFAVDVTKEQLIAIGEQMK
ncbi:hypothetical protein [Paenibacillus sp. KS-LC4]|uniref:hypothetical protein n=1 Tax=Paenibacillus sp. KS-LC4 TaxID=2979727 RepID=UPI0030D20731